MMKNKLLLSKFGVRGGPDYRHWGRPTMPILLPLTAKKNWRIKIGRLRASALRSALRFSQSRRRSPLHFARRGKNSSRRGRSPLDFNPPFAPQNPQTPQTPRRGVASHRSEAPRGASPRRASRGFNRGATRKVQGGFKMNCCLKSFDLSRRASRYDVGMLNITNSHVQCQSAKRPSTACCCCASNEPQVNSLPSEKDCCASSNSTYKNDVSKFRNFFENCLDILRNDQNSTNYEALRSLMLLFIFKSLEPLIDNNSIDFQNYDYVFDKIDSAEKEQLVKYTKFSNLAKEKPENIPVLMPLVWNEILAQHPITKEIFPKEEKENWGINSSSTFQQLIKDFQQFSFNPSKLDVIGEAYEQVLKNIMIGRGYGQFFTPTPVKQLMIDLIQPQVHQDGTTEKIYDPALGTAGFLITVFKYLQQQAQAKNICLDFSFIAKKGFGGREKNSTIYKLAVSNMLISSGQFCKSLELGDSIRDPINQYSNQFDIVLTNPPFGMKVKPNDIHLLNNNCFLIQTNDAVLLFLQLVIYVLKIKGRAAIILPSGEQLFSKKKEFVAVREFLMQTCEIKQIINLPKGMFTHTKIETCILYFKKKVEGQKILNKKITSYQTQKIQFYQYDQINNTTILVNEITMKQIEQNSYSLHLVDYLQDENSQDKANTGIIKTLGEICEFVQKSKRRAAYGQKEGLYPFFTSSLNVNRFVNEPDYREVESLIIGTGGNPNVNYSNDSFGTSADCYVLQKVKSLNNIDLKYVYYYLHKNLDQLEPLYIGATISHISKDKIQNIEIPIPSLDVQQQTVKYLDEISDDIKLSEKKISKLRKLNHMIIDHQKTFGTNTIQKLGEVFIEAKTGQTLSKADRQNQQKIYPFYGANGIIDYVENYLLEGQFLLTASRGSIGSLHIIEGKFSWSNNVYVLTFENLITMFYCFYYLQTVDFQKYQTGSAQPALNLSNLKKIPIHVPDLDRQEEIINYCQKNETLIQQLEADIKQQTQFAKEILSPFRG